MKSIKTFAAAALVVAGVATAGVAVARPHHRPHHRMCHMEHHHHHAVRVCR